MSTERYVAILGAIAEHERNGDAPILDIICDVARDVTKFDAAGITFLASTGEPSILAATNSLIRDVLEVERTVGEGPATDATKGDIGVGEENLSVAGWMRWPVYAPIAAGRGVIGVYALPVRIGMVRLGALAMITDHVQLLSMDQVADGHLLASVAARALLALQAGIPDGALAPELERAATYDAVIHQAAGMLAVQASMTIANALVALRAHGFAESITMAALARRVVNREIWFDPAMSEWIDLPRGWGQDVQ